MDKELTITLSAEEHNAILDAIEYALLMADSEIETNYLFDGFATKANEMWDPEDLRVWVPNTASALSKLYALEETISFAGEVSRKLAKVEVAG
jgi:hypothetical protein